MRSNFWCWLKYFHSKSPIKKNARNLLTARKQELKQALKEKDKQQIGFIADCTLDDAIVDEEASKSLKGYDSKTVALQTIKKGACTKQIGASIPRQFCINNKIEGYRNKTKIQYCDMIAKRKRHGNLDEVMYLKDFEDQDDNDDAGGDDEPDEEELKRGKKIVQGHKTKNDYGQWFLVPCHFSLLSS
jgi:hypothetical protein